MDERWSIEANGTTAVARTLMPRIECLAYARPAKPMAEDQDRQAGHHGGDRPRRPGRPGLGHQMVGHLPGHAQARRSRSPTTLVDRRVRSLTCWSWASQGRSAYAA